MPPPAFALFLLLSSISFPFPIVLVESRDDFTDEVTYRSLLGSGKELATTLSVSCRDQHGIDLADSVKSLPPEQREVLPKRMYDYPPHRITIRVNGFVPAAGDTMDFRLDGGPIITFTHGLSHKDSIRFRGTKVDAFVRSFVDHDRLRLRFRTEDDEIVVDEHDISKVDHETLEDLDCK